MSDYVAVLGLSTFGARVAAGLEESGMKVLAVDIDEKRVNAIKDQVSQAVCGDLRDQEMLREVGVTDCPVVIVGLADHFAVEVLTVHFLSNEGVREIIVQVDNEGEAAAIEKIGATRVVFPEQLAAAQLVRNLTLPGLSERVDLTEDAAVIEVEIPADFVGKSLKELDLRREYNVHVIGLIRPGEKPGEKPLTLLAPHPEDPLPEQSVLMVLGKTRRLRNFTAQLERLRADEEETGS